MFARVRIRNQALLRGLVLGCAMGVLMTVTAAAQPGRGGGIAPEELAKVQASQAKTVASELKLSGEQTDKLVAAYTEFQKAGADRPRGERGDWEAMRKQQEERQAKLAEELKAFMDEAPAKEAAAVLGGNNRGWDRLVSVILGFGLEPEKEAEALGHILAHVKVGSAAMKNASGDGNFDAIRASMAEAKKTLDTNINPLLSETQQAEWKEKTERGGRGQRGGGDRGDRGDRRDRGEQRPEGDN